MPVDNFNRRKTKRQLAAIEKKSKPGMPLIVWGEKEIQRVKDLAIGASLDVVADVMSVSRTSLNNIMERQPEVQQAYDEAKAYQHSSIFNKIYELMLEGDRHLLGRYWDFMIAKRDARNSDSNEKLQPTVLLNVEYADAPQSKFAHLIPLPASNNLKDVGDKK